MHKLNHHNNTIIIGAGGAGLMCAATATKRGLDVLVLDHSEKIGKKILISGGGRCNFTNIGATAEQYQSQNQHFCKSAFGQFTPWDFIALVEKHGIKYHEKKLGQQFCDASAQQIVDMLVKECESASAKIQLETSIHEIQQIGEHKFKLSTNKGEYTCDNLVIATGGLAIPKIGATNFGHRIAKQFGLKIVEPTPALVPFTFSPEDLEFYQGLSGISFDAIVSCNKMSFRENVLITHRGVSGPAILQISSYWKHGDSVNIHILPDVDWFAEITSTRNENPKQELKTLLNNLLPKRFVSKLIESGKVDNKQLGQVSDKYAQQLTELFTKFEIKPNGTEGFKKAEVTLGGVDTNELNAKTLESRKVAGLYFIGEVVDVTGWLGGYNFQWAWSSGFACGNNM